MKKYKVKLTFIMIFLLCMISMTNVVKAVEWVDVHPVSFYYAVSDKYEEAEQMKWYADFYDNTQAVGISGVLGKEVPQYWMYWVPYNGNTYLSYCIGYTRGISTGDTLKL